MKNSLAREWILFFIKKLYRYRYLNFLISIVFLFQSNLYGNSIHKNIELELSKNKDIKVNGVLKFEKNRNRYDIIFEASEIGIYGHLDNLDIKKEVKSVFLYDVNKDDIMEIFIIYKQNSKNFLEGYSLKFLDLDFPRVDSEPFFKTLNIATSQKLNKKIENIQNFNANLAKKELERLVPYYKVVNFNDYNIWDVSKRVGKDEYYSKAYLYQYELLPQDYEKFDLQKYFKIYSLDKLNFIKNTNNGVIFSDGNYYFEFQIESFGLITLETVFQGEISGENIIKNGKFFITYENGNYEKNSKTGIWNSYKYSKDLKRYLPVKNYFTNGLLTRKDVLYRKNGEIYTFSSTVYNSKNEIEKIIYYEENGEVSQIKTYKGDILEKAVNYSRYKREYDNYEQVVHPQSGYKYYKRRESLTLFKNLNLLEAKLENEKLNLYSIKDTNGKDIFIKFQNYSPEKTYFLKDGATSYSEIFKYFGVKEIFYGKRKKEKIDSYDDVVKDGYFEEFELGHFPDASSITGSPWNNESVVKNGYFENGLESGIWKTYLNGEMWTSMTYIKGVLYGAYEIYSGGNLLENGSYKNGEKIVEWKGSVWDGWI